ncbi:MAG: hypothetical protein CM15mP4_1150 [Candidatus Neomarinimicrobiota bacterium]|nr:MAG: hypothetical protein CM15mP4_1150 [Candidatus Neomarinimicrobiota bacterium]
MQFFSQTMSRFTKVDSVIVLLKLQALYWNDSLRKMKQSNKPIFMIHVICNGVSL